MSDGSYDRMKRINKTLEESGYDYRVGPDAKIDPKLFSQSAMRRFPKVMQKLHEAKLAEAEEMAKDRGHTKNPRLTDPEG